MEKPKHTWRNSKENTEKQKLQRIFTDPIIHLWSFYNLKCGNWCTNRHTPRESIIFFWFLDICNHKTQGSRCAPCLPGTCILLELSKLCIEDRERFGYFCVCFLFTDWWLNKIRNIYCMNKKTSKCKLNLFLITF